jgi:hypothetical protein
VEVDTVDVPEQILIQPPRQKSMRKVLIGPAMHATTPAIRKLSIGP